MTRTLVAVAVVFFLGSLGQLYFLDGRISEAPDLTLTASFRRLDGLAPVGSPPPGPDVLAAARWQTLATLESYALQRRYHQANVLLLSRAWITYLGFVTGMILAIVGATFVLGKLQEPAAQLAAEGAGAKLALQTASPGLVLATLGAALMFTTLVTHYKIEVSDRPSYINQWQNLELVLPDTASARHRPAALPPDSTTKSGETVVQ